MGRGRKRVVVVGATETGKTTNIKKMIIPRSGIDGLIVNDPNEQAAWYHLPQISLEQFERLKRDFKGQYRICDMDYEKFFAIAFKNLTNATIISEDATNYLGEKPNKAIMPNLIGLRHPTHNVDIIMITHSLMDTPKYIIRQCNEIILHKTNDVWHDVKGRFDLKKDEVEKAFNFVNNSSNPYEWERIILHKTGTI